MAEDYTFKIPRCIRGKSRKSPYSYQTCPDCSAQVWYSEKEEIFYCAMKGCYYVADVPEFKALCEDRHRDSVKVSRMNKALRQARANVAPHSNEDRRGVVYFIRFGSMIKIGTTVNISSRMSDLPWEEILLMEPGSYKIERQRHHQFRESRIRGEWFAMSDDLIQFIEKRRDELSGFNASRFPEQGAFPWMYGDVKLDGVKFGKANELLNPDWAEVLPISQASW